MNKRYIFRSKLRTRTRLRAMLLGLAASVAVAPAAVAQRVPNTPAGVASISHFLNATAPLNF